ncbi:MAG: peptide chain release factor N(5)-glutamine methyltransferase [Chitinophagaceae bacterium]|nr:MAG: peptide chain release factor N(5)-glutamine methyltransferase [Chitinophagaceae bacterium]
MTTEDATIYSIGLLSPQYGEGEATAITDLLMEKLTGLRGVQLISHGPDPLDEEAVKRLDQWLDRLLANEPVQYILGEAWFMDLKFYVDPSVLVPRPETEELADWIVRDRSFNADGLRLLDIGTGTGCLPVYLQKKLAGITADAIDISRGAIAIAQKNAAALGARVNFGQLDFLDSSLRDRLPLYDLVVSNPPYIPVKEKSSMPLNVTEFEPMMALFVPDSDPLVFYKAIADFGVHHLKPAGKIFVEIYEGNGKETLEVFTSMGYEAELKQDMQGKDRMIRATKKA